MQTSAREVMLTRVSGIVAGVTLTLFLSITLLPTAAHHTIDKQLATALRELRTLHGLCWLPMAESAVLDPQQRPAGSGGIAAAGGTGRGEDDGSAGEVRDRDSLRQHAYELVSVRNLCLWLASDC